MFSNRFYKLKLFVALTVIALLGVYSGFRGRSINPALWRCMAEPQRWDGIEIRAGGTAVDVTEGAFTLDTGKVQVPVRGTSEFTEGVAEGDSVTVRGIFLAEGTHVAMIRIRHTSPEAELRWLVELASLLVLAGILWNFYRKFSVHPETVRVGKAD